MLSNSEENIINKIIHKQRSQLQQMEEDFTGAFKQAINLFNAASYLCDLLLNYKLELRERIVSLYLVLVSFQGPAENHPFAFNVLYVSATADCNLERVIIYDILIRRNKTKYSSWLAEDIAGHAERDRQLLDEEKEIKSLRARMQQKYKAIECNLPVNSMSDSVPEFLRLVPDYIEISTSQLNWLSPGIISDVEWDNTAEVDKKLEKCRKIFESALKRTLEQQERTELLNSIESDPYSPLHIGFNVKDLSQLITHNSYVAASLVIKLSKYPVFQEYLEQFLALPTSAPLLDVTARIIKQIRVPQLYVQIFCSHHMNKMIKTREAGEDNYKGLAYTMTAFLHCMFENEIITPYNISMELKRFMNQFNNIMDFGHIRILMEQQPDPR